MFAHFARIFAHNYEGKYKTQQQALTEGSLNPIISLYKDARKKPASFLLYFHEFHNLPLRKCENV